MRRRKVYKDQKPYERKCRNNFNISDRIDVRSYIVN